jgi:hypothetical protein
MVYSFKLRSQGTRIRLQHVPDVHTVSCVLGDNMSYQLSRENFQRTAIAHKM